MKPIRRYKKLAMGGDYLTPREQQEAEYKKFEDASGAVPVYGQAIQAFSSIGRGIGSTTTDDDGVYKNKANEMIDNSFNPVTGVNNIKSIAKGDASFSNIANFASLGILGKGIGQEQAEEAKRLRTKQIQREDLTNGAIRLGQSDQGSSTNQIYAKFGGNIKSYSKGGDLKRLSSENLEVEGASHEEGGVKIAPDVEVEGNETINNNFVFSDELGFSDRHKPIAKALGKLEKKPSSNVRNTTIDLLKQKEEALKVEQENLKQELGLVPINYALGGAIDPEYGTVEYWNAKKNNRTQIRANRERIQGVIDHPLNVNDQLDDINLTDMSYGYLREPLTQAFERQKMFSDINNAVTNNVPMPSDRLGVRPQVPSTRLGIRPRR